MQIALVGLGKMGGNMVKRLMGGGHHVVGFDRDPNVVAKIAKETPETGKFEGAAAAINHPPLGVAGEEGSARSGVVVVEQLKEVREPTFLTAAGFAAEGGVAIRSH